MENLTLFILDFTILLPVTIFRMGIIYFFGSKYNIFGLQFLDKIMHAEGPYFDDLDVVSTPKEEMKQEEETEIESDSEEMKNVFLKRDIKYSDNSSEIDDIEDLVKTKKINKINTGNKKMGIDLMFTDDSINVLTDNFAVQNASIARQITK